ncbi:uncharacterized protein LOC111054155 isoform X6 [Nilaparvata lugens]|uniref:uncharacterized protein LOC111054155 isoform X6 n=1 Tax=Nilaparvata lugens TaxID=108931 RepID=UPI00193D022B|nr:uncharacterized protein LOC111054155 isoform X6 [Nilaparvata lugens]
MPLTLELSDIQSELNVCLSVKKKSAPDSEDADAEVSGRSLPCEKTSSKDGGFISAMSVKDPIYKNVGPMAHKYLSTKVDFPYGIHYEKQTDRTRAAIWLQKLRGITNDDQKKLRNEHLKLLLFALHRRSMLSVFEKPPPEELESFHDGLTLLEMTRELIELTEKKHAGGDSTGECPLPPVSTNVSADLKEYCASQSIPKFGAHVYYAVSNEPIQMWSKSPNCVYPAISDVPNPLQWELTLSKLTDHVLEKQAEAERLAAEAAHDDKTEEKDNTQVLPMIDVAVCNAPGSNRFKWKPDSILTLHQNYDFSDVGVAEDLEVQGKWQLELDEMAFSILDHSLPGRQRVVVRDPYYKGLPPDIAERRNHGVIDDVEVETSSSSSGTESIPEANEGDSRIPPSKSDPVNKNIEKCCKCGKRKRSSKRRPSDPLVPSGKRCSKVEIAKFNANGWGWKLGGGGIKVPDFGLGKYFEPPKLPTLDMGFNWPKLELGAENSGLGSGGLSSFPGLEDLRSKDWFQSREGVHIKELDDLLIKFMMLVGTGESGREDRLLLTARLISNMIAIIGKPEGWAKFVVWLLINQQLAGLVAFYNYIINDLNTELHIPGTNFCGPGTQLEQRMHQKGNHPSDEACKKHDLAYRLYSESEPRMLADIELGLTALKRLLSLDASALERFAGMILVPGMSLKIFIEFCISFSRDYLGVG